MFSHNRNWNDRANKDLFFTILSVKNIGIISGVEWSTIGNHMRTLGYGFTNEGCRYVTTFYFFGLVDGIVSTVTPQLQPKRMFPARG